MAELDTQRIIAEKLNFIGMEQSASLDESITEVRKMIYALRLKLKTDTEN